jgi:hypothetical protein
MLGNDHEINGYTIAIDRNETVNNGCCRKSGGAVGAMFSVRSVPKLYNEGQLSLQQSFEY